MTAAMPVPPPWPRADASLAVARDATVSTTAAAVAVRTVRFIGLLLGLIQSDHRPGVCPVSALSAPESDVMAVTGMRFPAILPSAVRETSLMKPSLCSVPRSAVLTNLPHAQDSIALSTAARSGGRHPCNDAISSAGSRNVAWSCRRGSSASCRSASSSTDPDVVRRQRCVNVGVFATAANSASHLIFNAFYDFHGLIVRPLYNAAMIVRAAADPAPASLWRERRGDHARVADPGRAHVRRLGDGHLQRPARLLHAGGRLLAADRAFSTGACFSSSSCSISPRCCSR